MVVLSKVKKEIQRDREGNAVCADLVILMTIISNENFNHILSLKYVASIVFLFYFIFINWFLIHKKCA